MRQVMHIDCQMLQKQEIAGITQVAAQHVIFCSKYGKQRLTLHDAESQHPILHWLLHSKSSHFVSIWDTESPLTCNQSSQQCREQSQVGNQKDLFIGIHYH
jgi:spore maturation protein CgeB